MSKFAQIALIGRPNAGKSTLMNAIIGEHLSIVTAKPQTTRRTVLGIHTDNDTQLVFIDTPGILRPQYQLQSSMMQYVRESLAACHILCVIVDVVKAVEHGTVLDPMTQKLLKPVAADGHVPIVLVLNKMDALPQSKQALPLIEQARESGLFTRSVAVSALQGREVSALVEILQGLAPEGDFQYAPDELSTMPQRFFAAEFIREAIFTHFREEIPYSTDVQVIRFDETDPNRWLISADITVERESQKGILIGKGGLALKTIGSEARESIEKFLDRHVHLELFVKVRTDWRNNRTQLSNLGY